MGYTLGVPMTPIRFNDLLEQLTECGKALLFCFVLKVLFDRVRLRAHKQGERPAEGGEAGSIPGCMCLLWTRLGQAGGSWHGAIVNPARAPIQSLDN